MKSLNKNTAGGSIDGNGGKHIFRHRRTNIIILIFLILSCLFFSVYDVVYEKIWWTSYSIYLPCSLLFLFGFIAWQGVKQKHLWVFGLFLIAIDLFLLSYGLWLWIQGESLWGPLTLGFALVTIAMTWSVFWIQHQLSDPK